MQTTQALIKPGAAQGAQANFGTRVEVRPATALAAALDNAAAGGNMTWQSYPVAQ